MASLGPGTGRLREVAWVWAEPWWLPRSSGLLWPSPVGLPLTTAGGSRGLCCGSEDVTQRSSTSLCSLAQVQVHEGREAHVSLWKCWLLHPSSEPGEEDHEQSSVGALKHGTWPLSESFKTEGVKWLADFSPFLGSSFLPCVPHGGRPCLFTASVLSGYLHELFRASYGLLHPHGRCTCRDGHLAHARPGHPISGKSLLVPVGLVPKDVCVGDWQSLLLEQGQSEKGEGKPR